MNRRGHSLIVELLLTSLYVLTILVLNSCTPIGDLLTEVKNLAQPLDLSFGGGDGVVSTPVRPAYDACECIAIQTDGKILAAGPSDNGTNDDIALLRYTPDGTLDTSFGGGDGIIITVPPGSTGSSCHAMALQADGKILLAGEVLLSAQWDFGLLRYTAAGDLDTSFGGGDGIVTVDLGSQDFGYSVAVQADDKILLAGNTNANGVNDDIVLLRFNPSGSLDTAFFGGGDGIVTTDCGSTNDYCRSVAIQAGGKILVTGSSNLPPSGWDDILLARYNSDGSLDNTFGGGDGFVTTAIEAGDVGEIGNSVIVQTNGRILVSGNMTSAAGMRLALVRYTSDGSLDSGFAGGDGIVTVIIRAWGMQNDRSLSIQANGRILVGGTRHNGTDRDFALVRFTADGSLDGSFGAGDGIAFAPVGASHDDGMCLAIQADGKIVVGGASNNGTDYDFALARFNP